MSREVVVVPPELHLASDGSTVSSRACTCARRRRWCTRVGLTDPPESVTRPRTTARTETMTTDAPLNAATVSVRASLDAILDALEARVEAPDGVSRATSTVRMVEREGSTRVREVDTGGATLVEQVHVDRAFGQVKYTLIDHALFEGDVVHRVAAKAHPDGTRDVSVHIRWSRRDGGAMADLTGVAEQAVLRIKYDAEARDPGFMPIADGREVLFTAPDVDPSMFAGGDDDPTMH